MHLRPQLSAAQYEETLDLLLKSHPGGLYRTAAKRLFDVVVVLLSLPLVLVMVLPLMAIISLDGGSPIYCQKRVGRNGREFWMWKLRTMVWDADARLEAHLARNPTARNEWDRAQKLRHDPRITAFGYILRKTSLDELPQIWNVLRGDMSLVGPRPMMIDQQALYPGAAYYALRPGITGLWQTSVRNESSFAQRAEFDTEYLRRLSFATDLQLLFRTLGVVVRGTGC